MSFVATCLCGLKNYGQPFKLYPVCGGFLNGIMDSVHLKEPSLTPLWNGWGNRGHRASVAAAESEGRPFPIASSDVCNTASSPLITSVVTTCWPYFVLLSRPLFKSPPVTRTSTFMLISIPQAHDSFSLLVFDLHNQHFIPSIPLLSPSC